MTESKVVKHEPAATAKKPYETPTLRKIGNVAEVTQGESGPLPDLTAIGSG